MWWSSYAMDGLELWNGSDGACCRLREDMELQHRQAIQQISTRSQARVSNVTQDSSCQDCPFI